MIMGVAIAASLQHQVILKGCGVGTLFLFPLVLTLIYPAHFEDVPCQSGVNHIFEG